MTFAHHAGNTRAEAEALRGLVAQRHWHSILLVTSNYHARRARYIFRRVFPPDVAVTVSSAADSEFEPDSWWTYRQGEKVFYNEALGYLFAMWELRGSQAGAAPAGAMLIHLVQMIHRPGFVPETPGSASAF